MSNGELSCGNCGVGHGPDDIFCENCGYDFITGSLPSGDEGMTPPIIAPPAAEVTGGAAAPGSGESPAVATAQPAVTVAGGVAKLRFSIGADRTYFDAVVSEGELDFPDPEPMATDIELTGTEFHIGRTSQSRAIHPDLDIAHLTGDPAVSSRHAVIRVADDGTVSVTDVGSTNGTFVGSVDGMAITVGEPVLLEPKTALYVGAWTRLEVTPVSA
ncbi:MAG: FHA domain-containing protein [Acidimicrobiia bacterium]|nr:FHA domain-containing protein [Acidimicrobiia bacterium]